MKIYPFPIFFSPRKCLTRGFNIGQTFAIKSFVLTRTFLTYSVNQQYGNTHSLGTVVKGIVLYDIFRPPTNNTISILCVYFVTYLLGSFLFTCQITFNIIGTIRSFCNCMKYYRVDEGLPYAPEQKVSVIITKMVKNINWCL